MEEQVKTDNELGSGEIRAIDLCGNYKDQMFKLKGGRVVWEAISVRANSCYISRMVEKGGKPFLMGLRYASRYISPDTILVPVNVCPMCFDPECTSDHK